MKKCPICGKDLKLWYSSAGGKDKLGCEDITCDYEGKEITK